MKKEMIIGLLMLSCSIFGQIPGKRIDGPIVIFDTLTVEKGDILYLGKGSNPENGNFRYLYAPKNTTIPLAKNILSGFFSNGDFSSKAIPQNNLDPGFAGKQLIIESFSKISSRKEGKRILGVIDRKEYQFIDGVFFNNIVVDFEPAMQSGEIIKITAPQLTEKAAEFELVFTPFEMTRYGIKAVVVAINNLSKKELYSKAINWTNSFYKFPNQVAITSVPDKNITIKESAKNVQFVRILGMNAFADLPYLFTIDFTDGEIRMTFTLGIKNGDITDNNGEVIANISPSHMFNKKGEVLKMGKIAKEEAEKVMNEISFSLVDYLMN